MHWALGHALPRRVLRAAADRGDLQARLSTDTIRSLPEQIVPLLDHIRAAGPIAPGHYARVTVDHEVVREVLSSNDFRTGLPDTAHTTLARLMRWSRRAGLHPVQPPSLLATEPPDHTRYRKLVTRVFTA